MITHLAVLLGGMSGLLTGGVAQGSIWTSIDFGDAPTAALGGHGYTVAWGRVWALAYAGTSLWSTSDGESWKKESELNSAGSTQGDNLTFWRGRLWSFRNSYLGDGIWSSADGNDWTFEVIDIPYPLRPIGSRGLVEFQDKIWVAGGDGAGDGLGLLNDVWMTQDGYSWSQIAEHAAWTPRTRHKLINFEGYLWVIGGRQEEPVAMTLNDVWRSSDGINWELVTEHAPWSRRGGHACTVYDGKLWLVGGRLASDATDSASDVWCTEDLIFWTKYVTDEPYLGRADAALFGLNGKLWLTGGNVSSGILFDTWSTTNGSDWSIVPNTVAWHECSVHAGVAFKDELLMLGGQDWTGIHNEVWGSRDGKAWSRKTEAAAWPARGAHRAVKHGKSLWLSGGTDLQTVYNDIWRSEDSVNWTLMTGNAAFSPRYFHGMASFDGKLWVVAGGNGSQVFKDVWFSEDGITWTQATAAAPWAARNKLGCVGHAGKLWVIGGRSSSGLSRNDIWHSEDGVNWTQVPVAGPRFEERQDFGCVSHHGKLYVYGGMWYYYDELVQNYYHNDVWSSEDGMQWTQVSAGGEHWEGRRVYGDYTHRGKLWIVGGEVGTFSSERFSDVWYSGTDEGQHSSDLDHDEYLNLSEVLRTVQLFNLGEFHCDAAGEDGYAPGAGDQNCDPHSGDYNPQDWRISLSELLRVIQLYNSGGYYYCPAADPPSEDGYCPAGAS